MITNQQSLRTTVVTKAMAITHVALIATIAWLTLAWLYFRTGGIILLLGPAILYGFCAWEFRRWRLVANLLPVVVLLGTITGAVLSPGWSEHRFRTEYIHELFIDFHPFQLVNFTIGSVFVGIFVLIVFAPISVSGKENI